MIQRQITCLIVFILLTFFGREYPSYSSSFYAYYLVTRLLVWLAWCRDVQIQRRQDFRK
jgi:hypothetical protein